MEKFLRPRNDMSMKLSLLTGVLIYIALQTIMYTPLNLVFKIILIPISYMIVVYCANSYMDGIEEVSKNEGIPYKIIAIKSVIAYLVYRLANMNIPSLLINLGIIATLDHYIVYGLLADLFVIIFLVFLFKSNVLEDIKEVKSNKTYFFSRGFAFYFLSYMLLILSIIILALFGLGSSGSNEAAIDQTLNSNLGFLFYFSVVIGAPIIEEFIYRRCIFNIIQNKYAAIAVSTLVFGLIHVHSFDEMYLLLVYGSMGFTLALCYELSNRNLVAPITTHFINNLIASL